MRYFMMTVAIAAVAAGCAEESDLRDPESFVPPDVLAEVEGPIARACMARFYVMDARSLECHGQMLPAPTGEDRIESCQSVDENFLTLECLDLWANGSCSDLTTPNAPDGCAMVNEW